MNLRKLAKRKNGPKLQQQVVLLENGQVQPKLSKAQMAYGTGFQNGYRAGHQDGVAQGVMDVLSAVPQMKGLEGPEAQACVDEIIDFMRSKAEHAITNTERISDDATDGAASSEKGPEGVANDDVHNEALLADKLRERESTASKLKKPRATKSGILVAKASDIPNLRG